MARLQNDKGIQSEGPRLVPSSDPTGPGICGSECGYRSHIRARRFLGLWRGSSGVDTGRTRDRRASRCPGRQRRLRPLRAGPYAPVGGSRRSIDHRAREIGRVKSELCARLLRSRHLPRLVWPGGRRDCRAGQGDALEPGGSCAMGHAKYAGYLLHQCGPLRRSPRVGTQGREWTS